MLFARPMTVRKGGERKQLNIWMYRSETLGRYVTIPDADTVCETCQCPCCGENRVDELVWIDDEVVECQSCSAHYDPNEEVN